MVLCLCLSPSKHHVSRDTRRLLFTVRSLSTCYCSLPAPRPLPFHAVSRVQPNRWMTRPASSLARVQSLSTCAFRPEAVRQSTMEPTDHEWADNNRKSDNLLENVNCNIDIIDVIVHHNQHAHRQSTRNDHPREAEVRASFADHSQLLQHLSHDHLDKALEAICISRQPGEPLFAKQDQEAVYQRIATHSDQEIIHLFRPCMVYDAQRRLWSVIKSASAFWSRERIQQMVQQCQPEDRRFQKYLFELLIADYRKTKDIEALVASIPSETDDATRVRLFNSAINACLRLGEKRHVEELVQRMTKSKLAPDAALYNIFIRQQLVQNDDMAEALVVYDTMLKSGVQPTTATYNTFLKYTCKRQQWEDVQLWLDRVEDGPKANEITLQIVLEAMMANDREPRAVDAFERVATAVPLKASERLLCPAVTVLLRHKRPDAALSLLKPLLTISSETLTSYPFNLLIHTLVQKNDMSGAHRVLDEMIKGTLPPADVVSFTTLIHGYVRNATQDTVDLQMILDMYRTMKACQITPSSTLQAVLLYGIVKSKFTDIHQASALFELLREKGDAKAQQSSDADTSRPISQTVLYNIMMDGYFLHYYNARRQSNTLTTATTLSTPIPLQPYLLLEDMSHQGIAFTTASLNIWVRGLAVFNNDLTAAERMVEWFGARGVEPNERTIWYLVKTAYRRHRPARARYWLQEFEKAGNEIQGHGLLQYRSRLL